MHEVQVPTNLDGIYHKSMVQHVNVSTTVNCFSYSQYSLHQHFVDFNYKLMCGLSGFGKLLEAFETRISRHLERLQSEMRQTSAHLTELMQNRSASSLDTQMMLDKPCASPEMLHDLCNQLQDDAFRRKLVSKYLAKWSAL